ncbi:zinc finger domain-containing protein [Streptomyces sp. bgisy029]|uniref:zinc finger domain-containing protein n=1 Tax=Streptomyces sp. bgisy029 TaxID=3413771 RepID=UPI003D759FC6
MDKGDAAELLGYCAAFDNRTVGEVDSTAWASALHDVPLDDDTKAAVARYYGTAPERAGDRLWIQPHHVRAGRLAIRQERLGTTLPAYEIPAGLETGAEFVARRRAQLDDVAAGRVVGTPVGRLTGDPAQGFLKELARRFGDGAVGRGVPDLDDEAPEVDPAVAAVRRPGPLGVECPTCGAAIGRPCRIGNPGGGRRPRELRNPHSVRGRLAAGEVVEVESAEDIERRRAYYLDHFEQRAGEAS